MLKPASSPAGADLERRIQELAPWFYEFQLGPFTTRSALPAEVRSIFETRLVMLEEVREAPFMASVCARFARPTSWMPRRDFI